MTLWMLAWAESRSYRRAFTIVLAGANKALQMTILTFIKQLCKALTPHKHAYTQTKV